MHDVLDGDFGQEAALRSHLAECEVCRAQWAVLHRTQHALSRCVGRPVEPAVLERLTDDVLAEVNAPPSTPQSRPALWRWVPVGLAAGLLLAFAAGLGAGRALWPREVAVTKVVTRREVVERPVKVEVPVPAEHSVVKHVPVVKRRIVYRDRPAAAQPAAEPETRGGRTPRVDGVLGLSAPLEVEVLAIHPVLRREVQPAAVVGEAAEETGPTAPPRDARASAGADQGAESVMLAQTAMDVAEAALEEDQ
jgi:hypothetical protein